MASIIDPPLVADQIALMEKADAEYTALLLNQKEEVEDESFQDLPIFTNRGSGVAKRPFNADGSKEMSGKSRKEIR